MAHTPGPWIGFIAENSFDILPAGRPGCIASCPNDGDHDADANSRLIAAAPVMLEALQLIYRDGCGGAMPTPIQNAVIAALAKATGQQS